MAHGRKLGGSHSASERGRPALPCSRARRRGTFCDSVLRVRNSCRLFQPSPSNATGGRSRARGALLFKKKRRKSILKEITKTRKEEQKQNQFNIPSITLLSICRERLLFVWRSPTKMRGLPAFESAWLIRIRKLAAHLPLKMSSTTAV